MLFYQRGSVASHASAGIGIHGGAENAGHEIGPTLHYYEVSHD